MSSLKHHYFTILDAMLPPCGVSITLHEYEKFMVENWTLLCHYTSMPFRTHSHTLKTFKASLYSSEKHFLFDNCGIMLYRFLLFCCELGQIYCSTRECGRCHQIVTPVTEWHICTENKEFLKNALRHIKQWCQNLEAKQQKSAQPNSAIIKKKVLLLWIETCLKNF